MPTLDDVFAEMVLLWAVIDPVGTVPVFLAATAGRDHNEQRRIARIAATTAAGVLLFFILVGELLLRAMGVPLTAFQIAGGLILFLFALTMIFGESKPEEELKVVRSAQDVAIFPLAMPSIASPGAMMAVVLLTDNSSSPLVEQVVTSVLMLVVVAIAYLMMRGAGRISQLIGEGGASIVSRVMGMILASIAATNVLEGIKEYFG